MESAFDLFIIGGGINGCGIARDAAGRGLSVALAEKSDLAQGTSSASTKLIHGGLRYLEHFEFRLVREALKEREILWRMAPHIIWPLRFLLPQNPNLRSPSLLRLGLFVYDHLGGREALPATQVVDLEQIMPGVMLDHFTRAYAYSDCWVDDSRLVLLNAQDAARRGALIMPRNGVEKATPTPTGWHLRLADGREYRARVLVNASGMALGQISGVQTRHRQRLVRGSHIVVPKIYPQAEALTLQLDDRRIIFTVPFEEDFTLIGTTDVEHSGDSDEIHASDEEIEYLCRATRAYFKKPVHAKMLHWHYSGVRALLDDGADEAQQTTRDYLLDYQPDKALLSVYGGKITTFRKLAEAALNTLQRDLGEPGDNWTADSHLPGGDFAPERIGELQTSLSARYPFLPAATRRRLLRAYGSNALSLLEGVQSEADLGRHFGAGLYVREVRYLCQHEWASTAQDILWRRTKLGLRLTSQQAQHLQEWLDHSSPRT